MKGRGWLPGCSELSRACGHSSALCWSGASRSTTAWHCQGQPSCGRALLAGEREGAGDNGVSQPFPEMFPLTLLPWVAAWPPQLAAGDAGLSVLGRSLGCWAAPVPCLCQVLDPWCCCSPGTALAASRDSKGRGRGMGTFKDPPLRFQHGTVLSVPSSRPLRSQGLYLSS